MSKPTFFNHLQSEYTLGKDLLLLPFELFAHVKAGRLHPLNKDTGRPIPRPDVSRKIKHLENLRKELDVLPLEYGALQTGKVYPFSHKQPQPLNVIFKGSRDQVKKQSDEWDKKSQQEKKEEMRKKQFDERGETLQKEIDALNKELDAIKDKNDWTTYDPPEEPKNLITNLPIDLMKTFDILQNARFQKSEVSQLNTTDEGQSAAKESVPETQVEPSAAIVAPVKEEPENYFRLIDADHWAIKFGDEFIQHIDHVDGFFYIARLLNNPREPILDVDLQSCNTTGYKQNAALNEGLSIDVPPKQEINDRQAQNEYMLKYNQLQSDLDNAESDLERAEIEKEMSDLLKYFPIKQKGQFVEPVKLSFSLPENKAAQANLTKRLKLAYNKIAKVAPVLAEHLSKNIKTDKFKRIYIGDVKWDVT